MTAVSTVCTERVHDQPRQPPRISGQLLPSRSLAALRRVLDRYRREEVA